MEDITARTIQTRLMLLIDLVYRLVLYGSVPAAVDNLSLSVTSTLGGDGDDNSGDGGDKKSSSSKKDVPSRSAKKKLIKSAIQKVSQLYMYIRSFIIDRFKISMILYRDA